MGRHFEVRAKAMAATAAKKSALYMRASKEIYIAARGGIPDPDNNLALRSAIDKWKSQAVPKDVIDRAIKKAAGGEAESYTSGRYEAFGPSGSYIIVDTLSDNPNRALVEVRTAITKHGGHLGSVIYNFTEYGVFAFKGANRDEVEENLILGDIDVQDVSLEDDMISVLVAPEAFAAARETLKGMGISEFETAEVTFLPNEEIEVVGDEEIAKVRRLLDTLDELQDVQAVYHNVKNV